MKYAEVSDVILEQHLKTQVAEELQTLERHPDWPEIQRGFRKAILEVQSLRPDQE